MHPEVGTTAMAALGLGSEAPMEGLVRPPGGEGGTTLSRTPHQPKQARSEVSRWCLPSDTLLILTLMCIVRQRDSHPSIPKKKILDYTHYTEAARVGESEAQWCQLMHQVCKCSRIHLFINMAIR